MNRPRRMVHLFGSALWRWMVPIAWLAGAIGFYGPWISHQTSSLTLNGADMAEFVKFLPGVLSGSVRLTRELFLLPSAAIVSSIALLAGSKRLRYPAATTALILALAVPLALQMLPPAWSLASLRAAEFRAQAVGLLVVLLLLATYWIWARLPMWLGGSLSALLAAAAVTCTIWQLIMVKPSIDAVYGAPSYLGWGLFVCLAGLVVGAVASAGMAAASAAMRHRGTL